MNPVVKACGLGSGYNIHTSIPVRSNSLFGVGLSPPRTTCNKHPKMLDIDPFETHTFVLGQRYYAVRYCLHATTGWLWRWALKLYFALSHAHMRSHRFCRLVKQFTIGLRRLWLARVLERSFEVLVPKDSARRPTYSRPRIPFYDWWYRRVL